MPKRQPLEPKKQPSQERSRDTVAVILQATELLLGEHGYDALTTNRIAARAGVNIATLYQYFPNKQAVFAELIRRHAAQTRAAALEVLAAHRTQDFAATVQAIVDASLAAHRVAPDLHRIYTQERPRLGLEAIEAPSDAAAQLLAAEWCKTARGRLPNPELALWIASSALHALIHLAIVERPDDFARPEFGRELARLLTEYLRLDRAKPAKRRRSATRGARD